MTVNHGIADVDTVHPRAIRSRDCVSGAHVDDTPSPASENDTHRDMVDAIGHTHRRRRPGRLGCTVCAGDTLDTEPQNLDWLEEASCFTIHCTRCHRVLESDCGEAHFSSTRAAAQAALAACWMVSAHRVWCRGCSALVTGRAAATAMASGKESTVNSDAISIDPLPVRSRIICRRPLRSLRSEPLAGTTEAS